MATRDQTVTRELPQMLMRGAFTPSSVDVETRTAELVWTTGARVKRGFWESYWEELSLDPKHVRMERLNNGAPLLAAHNAYELAGVLGVVEEARLEKTKGVAKVRFARAEDNPEADRAFRMVKDGILQNVSVGYRVHKLEQVEDGRSREDKTPVLLATDWEPMELSVVPMGADDGAGFRSARAQLPSNQCVIITRNTQENRHMDPETTTPPAPQPTAEERAALVERERVTTIQSTVQRHGLPAALGADLVSRGVPLAQANTRILEALAERSTRDEIQSHVPDLDASPVGRSRFEPGRDEGDEFRAATVDAVLISAGIRIAKPHAAARDVDPSVFGIARTCLSRAGKSGSSWFGRDRGTDLLKRAATTSDFSAILEGALHASLRTGYEDEPASHKYWVRVQGVPDFHEQRRPLLGSAPDLEPVGEGAEYKAGYLDDEGTGYTVAKHGRVLALTWEAMIQDRLGAFLRLPLAFGQSARRLEADLVYKLFTLNAGAGPTMADGVALFHANHANLESSAAFDAAQLGKGRTLLRKMKGLGGGYLSIIPRYLVVPAEREQTAEILLANAARRTTAEKTTPEWIASLELVVEPRLANTAVYLVADSNQVDTVELGLLEENVGGPHVEQEHGFSVDETRWKTRHTAGAKALDFRGMVKLPVT